MAPHAVDARPGLACLPPPPNARAQHGCAWMSFCMRAIEHPCPASAPLRLLLPVQGSPWW